MNEIYQGNCVDVMKNMEDESVDLVVTSPPYDDLRDYKGYDFDFKKIANELFRILKQGGVIVWVVGDAVVKGSETGSSFEQALYFKEIGLNLHDTMMFEKNSSSFPAQRKGTRYTQIFEYMFVFSKGKPKTGNLICDKKNKWVGWAGWGGDGGKVRDKNGKLVPRNQKIPTPEFSPRNNIWKYTTGAGFVTKDKIAYGHPAMFPEKLAEDHILTWSNPGDIVLDPMSGSGTVCKMALLNNRDYIGIDISEEYVKLSKKRMEPYIKNKIQTKLQLKHKPTKIKKNGKKRINRTN